MTKKLMNELLPEPKPAPTARDGSARTRVVEHMRKLMIGAATVGLSTCTSPFSVVDPLPQPARCKTIGDLLSDLSATATRSDGGSQVIVTLRIGSLENDGRLMFTGASGTTGGSLVNTQNVDNSNHIMTFDVTGPSLELFLDFSCDSSPEVIHAVIDLSTLQVTLTAQ